MRVVVVSEASSEAHKYELSVLHRKALKYLNRCSKTRSGIIKFPEVYRTLSWLLHLSRGEAKELLKELQNLNAIEVIPFHGVRILVGVGDDGLQ